LSAQDLNLRDIILGLVNEYAAGIRMRKLYPTYYDFMASDRGILAFEAATITNDWQYVVLQNGTHYNVMKVPINGNYHTPQMVIGGDLIDEQTLIKLDEFIYGICSSRVIDYCLIGRER
jgi:hypothetical protein